MTYRLLDFCSFKMLDLDYMQEGFRHVGFVLSYVLVFINPLHLLFILINNSQLHAVYTSIDLQALFRAHAGQ